jgi:cytochrome P450 family 6
LKNPKSEFSQLGHRLFTFTFHRGLEFTAIFLLPEIMKFAKFKFFTKEGTDFIMRSILYVMDEREKSKIKRNDLIDTLIEIKNSNAVMDDGNPITMEMLIAQAGLFFTAAFETSATTITHAIYEMAKNVEIQNKVRREIGAAFAKNDGQLNFEAVMHETPYLHQVLLETLRIYPVIPVMDRECTNPNGYSLKSFGSDFTIPYKMPIYIPLYGLHRDEKYFEDPLKFDPDRFAPENINQIPTGAYLPFGQGNRVCIGEFEHHLN